MKANFKTITIGLFAFFLLALPLAVLAGTGNISFFVGSEEVIDGNFIRTGNLIDVAGAVNGDVVAVGNTINISGPVTGDVVALGSTINISGDVSGSVFAAGSNVKISGKVGNSIRTAGSNVEIESLVEHNVWAAAATITLGENAKVGWDLFGVGASVIVNGPVEGNIWTAAKSLLLASTVGKDVTASIDSKGQAMLLDQAVIAGNLNYRSANQDQLTILPGATVTGETIHSFWQQPDVDFKGALNAAVLFFKVVYLFSLLAIGLIIISLIPKKVVEVQQEMIKHPGRSLVWGLIFILLTPLVIFLLLFTLIGIPIALILLALYLIILYISKVFVGFTLGLWVLNYMNKDKKYNGNLMWPFILGMILLVLIINLPLIGWVIGLLAGMWGIGAFLKVKKETFREYR